VSERPASTSGRGALRVVCHEATRTGAPRVLLDLLRLVRDDLSVPLEMRLDAGGPLAAELAALATSDGGRTPGAVLVNSALAADAVGPRSEVPAAIYIHEDHDAFAVLAPSTRSAIATRYRKVLCVSDGVRDDLLEIGVPAERIVLLPPVVVRPEPPDADAVLAAREAMGARPGDLVVLGCGEASWRKGTDLFVALARALADHPDVVFAWLGRRSPPFGRHLDHDVSLSDLDGRIRWLGELASPAAYLAAADLVAVTSRNDPQPLVPIEAALLGTPSIGFAIGGMVDLRDAGAAEVVPFPDVTGLASLVAQLQADAAWRARLVTAAVDRWQERQAPDVVGPAFLLLLDDLMRSEVRV
jgi:glycosyltransferase involved in cell wall biosynthesis